jgi:hypothetical protein
MNIKEYSERLDKKIEGGKKALREQVSKNYSNSAFYNLWEEGLLYRMEVDGNDHRWVVVDNIGGTLHKLVGNAKDYSLRQVIDRFKREFIK